MAAFCVWFVSLDMICIYFIPHASMTVVKGICGFYIELCVVIFVFLPGSEHVKVRLYKGVLFDSLHVKNLSAMHNLSKVILEHNYFPTFLHPNTEFGKCDH